MLRLSTSFSLFGETSEISSTANVLYLGCGFDFYLNSHEVSNPYGIIRGSINTTFSDDVSDSTTQHVGVGAGYQWRIGENYILRTEAQYLLMFDQDVDENTNGFTFNIRIATRFRL